MEGGMLFGPGGVVAVTLGAWGAWWLTSADDDRGARGRWPAILALSTAIVAFVTWSWLAEPVTLMGDALDHRGAVRQDLAARVPGAFWAGARALFVGWGLLAGGVFVAHRRAPTAPGPGDLAGKVLAAIAAAAAAIALLVVLVLSPQLLDADPRSWVGGRATVQIASWAGLALVGASLLASVAAGVRARFA